MRFTETTTLSGDDPTKLQSRKGSFAFNAKGVAASDITATPVGRPRERTISIGKVSPVEPKTLAALVKKGKLRGNTITIDSPPHRMGCQGVHQGAGSRHGDHRRGRLTLSERSSADNLNAVVVVSGPRAHAAHA